MIFAKKTTDPKLFFSAIALLFLPLWLQSQSRLPAAIESVAKYPDLQTGDLGVAVIDVESGKVIAQHGVDKSLIPASTLKTVTTASAVHFLGADYRFRTELQYDGEITADGTLNGNIYIKGYGDPTLASPDMEGVLELDELMQLFANAITEAGIQRINGKIVGDASYFTTAVSGDGWQWSDLGNYYGTGAWGLTIHENLFYLHFQQTSRLKATPEITGTSPYVPNLLFINEVRSAGANTGDNAYIYGGPYDYTRFVRGSIPVGSGRFTIKGSLPDPAFFAAHYLMQFLEKSGISTSKLVTTDLEMRRTEERDGERKTLTTHLSPPLSEIIQRANYKSVNLYCEMLLRAIGVVADERGSDTSGKEAIEELWESKGLDTEGWFFEDGSGLSGRNGITALQLAKILQLAAKDPKIFPSFYESLPVGGVSGTVQYMFKGTPAAGNIRAKSGSLRRVRSYAGYAESRSGKLLAFSVIANNFKGSSGAMRQQLEKIMVALCQ